MLTEQQTKQVVEFVKQWRHKRFCTCKYIKQELKLEVAEKPFVPLLVLSALTVAFAHGANDVRTTRGLAHCPHITGRCIWVGAL